MILRSLLLVLGVFIYLTGHGQLVLGKFIYWEGSGTKNSANNMSIPGSRNEAAYVQFPDGKLGVSGGFSPYNGYLKDQWKWNPYYGSTGRWELFAGPKTYNELGYSGFDANRVPTPALHGSRMGHGAFYTSNNAFALFGGYGYDSGKELNPSPIVTAGTFTQSIIGKLNCYWAGNSFIDGDVYANDKGDANHPSARDGFAYVTDKNGDHWIFGGNGESSLSYRVGNNWNLNDFWNVTKGQLKSGTNEGGNFSSVYGTQGVESTSNRPGSRTNSVMWCDGNGNIWLFGGWGVDANGNQGRLNDLWRYNTTTGRWAFMKGSIYANQMGVYNTMGIPDASSVPGGRNRAITAVDNCGNLWMYGGYGYDYQGNESGLADLWHYDINFNIWTFMGGTEYGYTGPDWNHKKTFYAGALPGQRWEGGAAIDTNGVFWLFGGNEGSGQVDDLWKMQLNARLRVRYLNQSTNEYRELTDNEDPSFNAGTDFGVVKKGNSVRRTFNLLNSSVELLKFTTASRIEITGTNASDFKIINKPQRTLKYRYGSSITIEFKPQSAGIKTAELKIYTNSAIASTFTVKLSGGSISDEIITEQWNWTNGSGEHGVYGNYLTGSNSGAYPGNREVSQSCTDEYGRVWMFGGWGYAANSYGWLNDLWSYDARTGQWTWHSGSSTANQSATYGTKGTGSTSNVPAGRQNGALWYHNGFIYLFGGHTGSSYSNELWKFEISTGKWTWVGGTNSGTAYGTFNSSASTDYPGGRYFTTYFQFNGKFYLFGGYGYNASAAGFLNDLWEFDPSNGYWTFLKGTSDLNKSGVYGTKGTGDQANYLGGRYGTAATCDKNGNAYFFGGYGYASSSGGQLNDLWKYDIANNEFTWISGTSGGNGSATYGTKGTENASNVPGSRRYSGLTTDESGNVWLFGGDGYDTYNSFTTLNDLWKYDVTSGNWTWMGGDNIGYLFKEIYNQNFQDDNRGLELTTFNISGNSYWNRYNYNGSWYAEMNAFGGSTNSEDWMITPVLNFGGCSNGELVFRNVSYGAGANLQILVSTDWDGSSLPSTANWTDITSSANLSSGNWQEAWSVINISSYISTTTYVAFKYTGNYWNNHYQQIDDISVRGIRNFSRGNYSFTGSASASAYPSARRHPRFHTDNTGAFVLIGGTGPQKTYWSWINGLNDVWQYLPKGGYIWDGSNTTWATSGNWESTTTPDSNVTILVPAGKSHYPIISSKTAVKNLYVSENAAITINSGQVLRVKGDLNLRGTVTGSGTILLCGDGSQKVQASNLGNVRIRMSSGDLNLSEDLEITGELNLVKGDIVLGDNNLTLSGTTSHGSAKSYIKIDGAGKVKTTVGSTPVIIPIGRNPYLPVIIDDGGNAEFSVGVANSVYENPETQNPLEEIADAAVSETWTITSDATVNNVNITIGWDGAEELANFDRTNSTIAYWEKGVSSTWKITSFGSATGSDPYFLSATIPTLNADKVYYFGVGTSGSALPVQFSMFNANWLSNEHKIAILDWQTASEQNNSHFEIERSFNGVDFEKVGIVEGAGSTFSESNYQFSDYIENNSGFVDLVYYRLKQVDFDGKFDYSEIRKLSNDIDAIQTFSVWPNPTNLGIVQFSVAGNYSIFNLQGVLLKQIQNESKLDVSDFKAGTYIIKSSNGFSQYLVVQP